MKKLLTAVVALFLFAACKGKGTDTANTSTTTPATTSTTTPAAPEGTPIEKFVAKAADCMCPALEEMGKIADQIATTTDEAAKAALYEKIDQHPKPPCMKDLLAEEQTMGFKDSDKPTIDSAMQAALNKRCGEAFKKMEQLK